MSSLRQKIGQMLIMGFAGCEIDLHSPVARWLKEEGLGGVLLFDFDVSSRKYGKNLKNQEQIKQLIRQLKKCSVSVCDSGEAIPLLVALDYEGGAVDRLTKVEGCKKTMRAVDQALLSADALKGEAEKMAETLRYLGFNLNFSPVVDLNLNEEEGIIGKLGRSFSADPEEVIRAAKQIVRAFHHYGVACTYKHFPGHGSAVGDTHEGFVDVTNSYDPNELVPYTKLLNDAELPPAMVMTAHVINRHLDESGLPATLSYRMITELLRHEIGFDGVVISDDLQMQAISHHYSIDDALRYTINAGADMVIFANQLGQISAPEVIDHIENLVNTGGIKMDRIEQAYQRVLKFKKTFIDSALFQVASSAS